jgi:hypothetical protein
MAAVETRRWSMAARACPCNLPLIAASERRAEMLPLFLAEIDRYLAGDAAERSKPTPLLFIFHLLGEWRETSAYRQGWCEAIPRRSPHGACINILSAHARGRAAAARTGVRRHQTFNVPSRPQELDCRRSPVHPMVAARTRLAIAACGLFGYDAI